MLSVLELISDSFTTNVYEMEIPMQEVRKGGKLFSQVQI